MLPDNELRRVITFCYQMIFQLFWNYLTSFELGLNKQFPLSLSSFGRTMEFFESIRLLETLFAFRISIIMLWTQGLSAWVFFASINGCLPENHHQAFLINKCSDFWNFSLLNSFYRISGREETKLLSKKVLFW